MSPVVASCATAKTAPLTVPRHRRPRREHRHVVLADCRRRTAAARRQLRAARAGTLDGLLLAAAEAAEAASVAGAGVVLNERLRGRGRRRRHLRRAAARGRLGRLLGRQLLGLLLFEREAALLLRAGDPPKQPLLYDRKAKARRCVGNVSRGSDRQAVRVRSVA